MENTNYNIKETVNETSKYGTFEVTYHKSITIKDGYQTEMVRRNGQIVASGNYPANTEYAEMRRRNAGMTW